MGLGVRLEGWIGGFIAMVSVALGVGCWLGVEFWYVMVCY